MSKNQKDEYYGNKNRKQQDETGEYGKSNDNRDNKKDNRGGRGKSGSNKSKGNYPRNNSEKTTKNSRITEGYNDVDWYVPEPVIMQQALSIPFTEFLGSPINRGLSANVTGEETYQIPTVMGIYLNPSPGFTTTGAGARDASINRQAKRLYVKLSSRNAKTTNYTPDDIAILLLQLGEVISMVSFAQRTYGLIWNWNIRNKGISDALLRASRINPETISMTPYEYLGRLNSIIFSLNSIVFPMSFSYFDKCAALYSSVFVDSPTRMAQMYIPCPSTTWIIDETGSTGSILKTKTLITAPFGNETMSASALLKVLEDMVDAIQTSSTFNLIFSDVLKLMEYENVPTMGYKTIPIDYSVSPKYDAEWNIQIMNAKVMGMPSTLASPVVGGYTRDNDVVADVTTASVQHAPKFTLRYSAMELDPLVNFFTDVPSDSEKLLATRFYSHAKRILEGSAYVNDPNSTTLTDHYITHFAVYSNDNKGAVVLRWLYSENVLDMNNVNAGLVMCDLNKFNFYPITDIVKVDAATKVESYIGVLNDLDSFTTVPFNTIRRVNELTQYGLFDPRLKYPGTTQVN